MAKIYYIGGSPCAGKSTVAEILSQKYDLYYFKVDDFLDSYTKSGALKGYPICKKTVELNAEQIWMRDPSLQCREEFQFYEEIFEYIVSDLNQHYHRRRGVCAEFDKAAGYPKQQVPFDYPHKGVPDFPFQKENFCPICIGRMQRYGTGFFQLDGQRCLICRRSA